MVYAKKVKIFRKASDQKQKTSEPKAQSNQTVYYNIPHSTGSPKAEAIIFIIGEGANTYMKRN